MSHTLAGGKPVIEAFGSAAHGAPNDANPLARVFDLPLVATLEVPVLSFTVGSLMSLAAGSVVETAAQQSEDLDLSVNGQLVGTVEIDVTSNYLAVRLTGIA